MTHFLLPRPLEALSAQSCSHARAPGFRASISPRAYSLSAHSSVDVIRCVIHTQMPRRGAEMGANDHSLAKVPAHDDGGQSPSPRPTRPCAPRRSMWMRRAASPHRRRCGRPCTPSWNPPDASGPLPLPWPRCDRLGDFSRPTVSQLPLRTLLTSGPGTGPLPSGATAQPSASRRRTEQVRGTRRRRTSAWASPTTFATPRSRGSATRRPSFSIEPSRATTASARACRCWSPLCSACAGRTGLGMPRARRATVRATSSVRIPVGESFLHQSRGLLERFLAPVRRPVW
jgi:hypothetical protein